MIKNFYRYALGISFIANLPPVVSMHSNNDGIQELSRQRQFRGVHIRARELRVQGRPSTSRSITNNDSDERDFDLSEEMNDLNFVWPDYFNDGIDVAIKRYNFDRCIPMFGTEVPTPDIAAINSISARVSNLVECGKIYPTTSRSDYLSFLADNTSRLPQNISELPDNDCLYYKNVKGKQHLFLHISSQHTATNKGFRQAKATNSVCAIESDVFINAQQADLVNTSVFGDRVVFDVTNLLDQASKLQATEVLYIKADQQKHETVIEKWVRDSRWGSNYVHAEGIKSINDCELIAPIIVQDGDTVQNLGISVQAMCFEDRAANTSNMPATVRLYNDSHAEKRGWFSKSVSHIHKEDDANIPTRYQVNYYRSLNVDGKPTSVKFGYTLIDAGSDIIITKDDAQAIPITARHVLEIHESSSGFSIFGLGRAGVPDPIGQLQAIHRAYETKNMIGLTTSTISAAARTIRMYEDIKSGISQINNISLSSALSTLSRFIQGPTIQWGWRSVDVKHVEEKTLGNYFKAKNMIFHTDRVSFCGNYEASENIDIKTKTFVVFAMPNVLHESVSMSSGGIQMDLLTFAILCFNPDISGVTSKVLTTSSVSANYQNTETHIVQNVPTTIRAGRKLNIDAENGYITQAQIKAALVHAIFTNDCILETLANEFKQSSSGGGFSMGLSAFNGSFSSFVDALTNFAGQCTINSVNSGRFEHMIDEYASMIGTEEFYLKVGNILKTTSVLLGHEKHDTSKEHIEFKEWQKNLVREIRQTWDNSFSISIGDLIKVASALKEQCFSEALASGMKPDEADKLADKKSEKEVTELAADLKDAEQAMDEVDKETDSNLKKRMKTVSPDASKEEQKRIKRENTEILEDEIKQSAQKKKAILNNRLIKKLQEQSLKEKLKSLGSSRKQSTGKRPVNPSEPEKNHPNRAPLRPGQSSVHRDSERRRRDTSMSGGDRNHNRKIDPNTIDWAAIPEGGEIECKDIDWTEIRTKDQAGRVDLSKIRIGLHDSISGNFLSFQIRLAAERAADRPPTSFEVMDSIENTVIGGCEASIGVLGGLWNYINHVCDNPQAAIQEANDYVGKCCQSLKDYVVREGTATIESLQVIAEHSDLFMKEIRNIANDPRPFIRELMETDAWKVVRLHPAFAKIDTLAGVYFDIHDAENFKSLQPAVNDLRNRTVSSYISSTAKSLFGKRVQVAADVVMNFL